MKEKMTVEDIIEIFPRLKTDLAKTGLEIKKIIPAILAATAMSAGKEVDFAFLSQNIAAEIEKMPKEIADSERHKLNTLRIWHRKDRGNEELWEITTVLKELQEEAAELEEQIKASSWAGLNADTFKKKMSESRVKITGFLTKMERANEVIGKITNIYDELIYSLKERLLILKELKDLLE